MKGVVEGQANVLPEYELVFCDAVSVDVDIDNCGRVWRSSSGVVDVDGANALTVRRGE